MCESSKFSLHCNGKLRSATKISPEVFLSARYGVTGASMVWYGMVWYGVVWCGMVWYGMIWYDMVWYGMVWYGMVWYDSSNKVVKWVHPRYRRFGL